MCSSQRDVIDDALDSQSGGVERSPELDVQRAYFFGDDVGIQHAAQIDQQLLKPANRVAQRFSTLGKGLEAERGILGRYSILRRRILTRFKTGRLG